MHKRLMNELMKNLSANELIPLPVCTEYSELKMKYTENKTAPRSNYFFYDLEKYKFLAEKKNENCFYLSNVMEPIKKEGSMPKQCAGIVCSFEGKAQLAGGKRSYFSVPNNFTLEELLKNLFGKDFEISKHNVIHNNTIYSRDGRCHSYLKSTITTAKIHFGRVDVGLDSMDIKSGDYLYLLGVKNEFYKISISSAVIRQDELCEMVVIEGRLYRPKCCICRTSDAEMMVENDILLPWITSSMCCECYDGLFVSLNAPSSQNLKISKFGSPN